jgi:hypothetical protein
MTYAIGQKFQNTGMFPEVYVLAQVAFKQVGLVSIESGNRWYDPVNVVDVTEITETEFEVIAGDTPEQFELITKETN